MKELTKEAFNYKLESDAIIDVFSTAGEEEINQDNFKVLTNKNLTVLILASGEGRSTLGDILSEMATTQALEILDDYQFNDKSPIETVQFLESMFLNINNTIIEYLEVANINDGKTSLSIAIIHNNKLFTATIGESEIYAIYRGKEATLLTKNNHYLGEKELKKEDFSIKEEGNLYHKEIVFLCSHTLLESISKEDFRQSSKKIKELLTKTPPKKTTSFLRYLHYERSVEILRIEKEDIEGYQSKKEEKIKEEKKREIEWRKFLPLIRKIALPLGILLILTFFYLVFNNNSNKKALEVTDKNQTKIAIIENNHSSPIPLKVIKKETKEIISPIPKKLKKESETKLETIKLLKKADSDVLYLGEKGLHITFKNNQLIASKKDFFYEKNQNSQLLYGSIKAKESELQGEIINQLDKQNFINSVKVKRRENDTLIKIKIKNSCSYTRSNWAKNSGLDLLTFTCEK